MLRPACAMLVDDFRGEIIQYVLCHIDETLEDNVGESQRKADVPPARALIRNGTKALDQCALMKYQQHFYRIAEEHQHVMLLQLSEARMEIKEPWEQLPQKAYFQKLLAFTVEAYFSHPKVWSEMGYGGPAYPRGYIRTGIGQLDPWEAKRNQ